MGRRGGAGGMGGSGAASDPRAVHRGHAAGGGGSWRRTGGTAPPPGRQASAKPTSGKDGSSAKLAALKTNAGEAGRRSSAAA
eukprot:3532361-Pleurochrysis_carterae.AAC.1